MMKTPAKTKPSPTTMVPVTTMEEVPVVSEQERAELLASLKDAEADIAAGNFVEFEPGTLEPWLREHAAEARRNKHGV